jgi:hypothetical protein
MANILGLKTLSIDGITVDCTGEGITYSFGEKQLTEIMGADRHHGFSAMPIPAFMQFSLTDSQKLEMASVLSKIDVTIQAILENGKILVLAKASNTSDRSSETKEGKTNFRFVGSSLTVIKA